MHHEPEVDTTTPFLDTMITRNVDSPLKVTVYRKDPHADQYLHFTSHHPLQHQLGVVNMAHERSNSIVTDSED